MMTDEDEEVVVSWQRKNVISSIPHRSLDLVRRYNKEILSSSSSSSQQRQRQQQQQQQSTTTITEEVLLKRVQKIASTAAAAFANQATTTTTTSTHHNDDANANAHTTTTTPATRTHRSTAAEYRCLETGGFLLPTVTYHPLYKKKLLSLLKMKKKNQNQKDVRTTSSVLDIGCGLASDARQMLIDGFTTNVIGIDRSELYIKLGCELFGDDPNKSIIHFQHLQQQQQQQQQLQQQLPQATFLVLDLIDQQTINDDDDDDDTIVATIRSILQKQKQKQQVEEETTTTTNTAAPTTATKDYYFDAIYAGKFLHCLETETNLRIVLQRVWELLDRRGVFFGVFGRNYQQQQQRDYSESSSSSSSSSTTAAAAGGGGGGGVFECSSRDDFVRVLTEEGFDVESIVEEKAGATWFCAYKETKKQKQETE